MILGNGLIGTALRQVDNDDVLYCASGVSNLFGHIQSQCLREENLLRDNISKYRGKTVVYFSSYSIQDTDDSKNTPYLLHKKNMESLVQLMAPKYLIARTSNVVGKSGQPGNLTNFIFHHLLNATPFEVWKNTNRNLIDVQHLAAMANYYLQWGQLNKTVHLINPKDVTIEEVVKSFENKMNRKANYSLVDKGTYYHCDKTVANHIFEALQLPNERYVEMLIEKYFI
ncbi:hypothetical protein [Arachidicoccus sp.]|uniref:hypothetical protein n=1 Tax=Arachidicoccus sp. TaxID=1872624 RepID=UPI003D21496C